MSIELAEGADVGLRIDAGGVHARELNQRIRAAFESGASRVTVDNVRGQRYIGVGLASGRRITVNGVAGNDLAAFMDGGEIVVNGNAQDGVGNTMNGGKVLVNGDAGDVLGHSLRGGMVFVRGSVGYRAGIHMKQYGNRLPVVVVGGRAADYLGEYLAGGILVVLGLASGGTRRPRSRQSPAGCYLGTGMHGGVIFLRGGVEPHQVGLGATVDPLDSRDWLTLGSILTEYCADVGLGRTTFGPEEFVKLVPRSTRPYGGTYAY